MKKEHYYFFVYVYMTVVVGINGVDEQICGIPLY